jgi:myo-inositol 2-dehydrogenase/D-chiro-inositol 1-dehydrogenase
MLKFGLIGAGRIGRIHGSNVAARSDAKLVAVADADGKAASALAGETGARSVSLEEALGGSDIDAVLICAPTDMHADLI